MKNNLPFADETFDLVLDSYVFCHFVDRSLKEHFRSEMYRVTRPKGKFFSSLFSTEDEYYCELLDEPVQSDSVAVDPRNGIAKQLYTADSIKVFYGVQFTIKYFTRFEFDDFVGGRSFRRSVFALLMEK